MRKQILYSRILILLLWLTACHSPTPAARSLKGEWRYVGTFSHLADYRCLVCPEFDYGKSLYRIDFSGENSFAAQINLLIAEGQAAVSRERAEEKNELGSFQVKSLHILNKPLESEADGLFKERLRSVSRYFLVRESASGYDYLQLQFSEYEYLYFVRKKGL